MDNNYQISTDKSKLDVGLIHDYLSKHSYWANGRSLELVEKSIDNSLCFGVFNLDIKQIAFARVITDYVVFAWLMDLFVIDDYKGHGVGKFLMNHISNHKDLINVNGFGLRTNDAHSLYKQFGFKKIPEPHTWMFKKDGRNTI